MSEGVNTVGDTLDRAREIAGHPEFRYWTEQIVERSMSPSEAADVRARLWSAMHEELGYEKDDVALAVAVSSIASTRAELEEQERRVEA